MDAADVLRDLQNREIALRIDAAQLFAGVRPRPLVGQQALGNVMIIFRIRLLNANAMMLGAAFLDALLSNPAATSS